MAVSRRLGRPGAVLLNMSYEWSCTAGVGADPMGPACACCARSTGRCLDSGGRHWWRGSEGGAGDYYSVTWPGYVGVLTGMAPGRFAAAINQPPLRRISGLLPLDWVIARRSLWRSRGLPPSHLLRRVFDECRSFGEAKRMLIETPLCAPTFYSLAGTGPGEGCIIERTETAAAVRPAPGRRRQPLDRLCRNRPRPRLRQFAAACRHAAGGGSSRGRLQVVALACP